MWPGQKDTGELGLGGPFPGRRDSILYSFQKTSESFALSETEREVEGHVKIEIQALNKNPDTSISRLVLTELATCHP